MAIVIRFVILPSMALGLLLDAWLVASIMGVM